MNFTEAVSEILEITGRPDKQVAAENAVNSILNLLTYRANFVEDLVEATHINAQPTLYEGTISKTTFPNLRKLKYIRATSIVDLLEDLPVDKIITNGVVRKNIFYLAGTNINWVLDKVTPSFEIGYYVFPSKLTDASPTHWMLTMYPYAIVDLAIAKVFLSIGDTTAASGYQASGTSLYLTMRNDMEDGISAKAQ